MLNDSERAARIGAELSCPLCDRTEMPDGMVRVRTAGPFDEETVPAGLRTWHRVADSTWGCLCVIEGSLTLTFDLVPPVEIRLEEGGRQTIPPGLRHLVTLDGPARFAVEFYVGGRHG